MNNINKCYYKRESQKKSCCSIFRWPNKHNSIKIKKEMMKSMKDINMILIILCINNIKRMKIKIKIKTKITIIKKWIIPLDFFIFLFIFYFLNYFSYLIYNYKCIFLYLYKSYFYNLWNYFVNEFYCTHTINYLIIFLIFFFFNDNIIYN